MTIQAIMQLVSQIGVPLALVIFFVWNGNKREQRITKRLEDLEDYTRNELQGVIKANTVALENVQKVLES